MTNKLPLHTLLADRQTITVTGPDGTTTTYTYDLQTRSLNKTDCSSAVSCRHGASHIGEDPIPDATCDSPGLMSADDKCKLNSFTGTRIGVLGFMGSGFCVAPGCRVLMADGTHKPIEKIVEGDVVITHTGSPRVVEKTFVRDVNEQIATIDCRGHKKGGLKLTKEHKVLAISREDVECVRPDCKNRKGLPCRHNSRRCDGCEFENITRATPKWMKACDLNIGDFIVSKHSSIIALNS